MLSKGELLARRVPEADFEIEGVGSVRIRGLTRAEAIELRKVDDAAVADRRMVALGLVEPRLSEAEVKTWQENSGIHEIEALTVAIGELSAQGKGATKSGVPGV